MKAITFPFTLNPFGVVNTSTLQSKVYKDRVLTLLSTAVGERPMRPSYGTDLAKALFETQNQAEKAIRLAISTAIGSWIPEVSVQQINVLGENLDGKMTVELLLVFPDFTSETISVSTATLNPDGSITR